MKKVAKKIYECTTLLMKTLVSLCSVLLFSKYNVKKVFKNIQESIQNEPLYILGNGNSLNSFLESGKDIPENLMVVNHFASSPFFRQVKPRNYIIVDNNLCIAPETPEGTVARDNLINSFLRVDWEMNLYMPTDSSVELLCDLKKNENLNIVQFNRTPVDGFYCICDWLYDMRLGMPIPQNVTNAAIFCGIASGYKTIYLYGAEHSWTKSFEVDPVTHQVYMNDGHFYQNDNKRYIEKGVYKEWLKAIYLALKSHEELRRYADKRGVKVINRTPQSFVDAYDFE
jgi:hypothetical protein